MPIYEGNKTFCGVNKTWTPRISQSSAIAACVVPSLFAWIFAGIASFITIPYVFNEDSKIRKILVIFKIVWDAIDVTLDAVLFYQLEMGMVLDESIIRNPHVMNAILGFAVFGCVKISFWCCGFMYVWWRGLNVNDDYHLEDNNVYTEGWEHYMVLFTFYFEDGPELILEYFYIEKYVTVQPPWYLFVKDVVIALLALYMVINVSVNYYCKMRQHKDCNISINVLLIGALMFTRVGAAGYQYVTGKLKRSCFEVEDMKLVQTPFKSGCLREVDYTIIVFCCLLLLMMIRNIQHAMCYLRNFDHGED